MKFAYMIMAHHRPDVLEQLLTDLDDERNDIFLHIDKKSNAIDEQTIKKCVKKARIILIKRISVYWGDYSIVKCILNLLEAAVEYGYHDYYHLLVGVEFPLKTQDYLHKFFEANRGKEFIGFDNHSKNFTDRIKYYHLFAKDARSKYKYQHFLYRINKKLLVLQKKIHLNRLKEKDSYYKKGYMNWSITHDLALLFISEGKKQLKTYRYSSCSDELVFQTITYNSTFYNNVYDINDEYHSCMRITTWVDPKNQFHMKDVDMLLSSGKLFARKFDTDDAVQIIKEIVSRRAS